MDVDNHRDKRGGGERVIMPSGSSRSSKHWTEHERKAVIRGMARYGHDYTQLATLVPPRTAKAVERYIDRHALTRNSQLDEERDEGSNEDDHDVVDDDGTNETNGTSKENRNTADDTKTTNTTGWCVRVLVYFLVPILFGSTWQVMLLVQ